MNWPIERDGIHLRNQRTATRAGLTAAAGTLTGKHRNPFKIRGWVMNLSTSGAYLDTCGKTFTAYEEGTLNLTVLVDQKLFRIKADCTIVRHDESGMGIRFENLDAEMAERLEELVQANLGPHAIA